MKDFRFNSSEIVVSIKGREYRANYGDADLQQDMLEFALALGNTDVGDISGGVYVWASERIHDFIKRLLGAEAEHEIFEGEEPSILEELRLFNHLQEAINANAAVKELEVSLGRFSPSATK
ncbi:MAG: hypothetical protein LBI64_00650 [Coriobacteriales bacterium]|jgi:hypothetical protein|nr:hypothetical protein [Coriobacteriales bacterium]